MPVVCACCGGEVREEELARHQLCAGCFDLFVDELTTVAVRVGRFGRHDAETVVDVPLPVVLRAAATTRVAQVEAR